MLYGFTNAGQLTTTVRPGVGIVRAFRDDDAARPQ